ncbi:MAG: hypothetical protein K8T10_17755 [Candidatus Eremiobacteraeota bacterium]|nr:hypothetical protein [Candidatus Eremiobacteraeota bacterium]
MSRIHEENDFTRIKGISFALFKKSNNITLLYSALMIGLFWLIQRYASKMPVSDSPIRTILFGISYVFFFLWVAWFFLILIPVTLKICRKTGEITAVWLGIFPQKIGTRDDVEEVILEKKWESEKSGDQAVSPHKKIVMLKFKSGRTFPVLITGNDNLAHEVSLELTRCLEARLNEST